MFRCCKEIHHKDHVRIDDTEQITVTIFACKLKHGRDQWCTVVITLHIGNVLSLAYPLLMGFGAVYRRRLKYHYNANQDLLRLSIFLCAYYVLIFLLKEMHCCSAGAPPANVLALSCTTHHCHSH